MKKEFDADRLDLAAFAQDAGVLARQDHVSDHTRLMAETAGAGGDAPVTWSATGELRESAGSAGQVWLHLDASTRLTMTCQRCLTPVEVPVNVSRSFRFVADEATAAAQDDEAEEDVLVLSRDFDLAELVEDELLMDLPVVPKHEVCPVDVKLAVADPGFEAGQEAAPNPFAVLQKLKADKDS